MEASGEGAGEWDPDRIAQVLTNLGRRYWTRPLHRQPLVAAHRGAIQVRSSREESTTFTVRLPRRGDT